MNSKIISRAASLAEFTSNPKSFPNCPDLHGGVPYLPGGSRPRGTACIARSGFGRIRARQTTRFQNQKFRGTEFRALGASVDDGPNVELSLTVRTFLALTFTLFIRRFRRGPGCEFLEARIISTRIANCHQGFILPQIKSRISAPIIDMMKPAG
jgi:hypothetical protein